MSEIPCVLCQQDPAYLQITILNSDKSYYVCSGCFKLLVNDIKANMAVDDIFDQSLKN